MSPYGITRPQWVNKNSATTKTIYIYIYIYIYDINGLYYNNTEVKRCRHDSLDCDLVSSHFHGTGTEIRYQDPSSLP